MKKSQYYYQRQPKVKIDMTLTDWLLEALIIMGVIVGTVVTVLKYENLPDVIPTKYDFSGNVIAYGGKVNILILVGLMIVMYLFLVVINRFPHTFNYLVKITEQNAYKQYKLAMSLIRWINLEMTWLISLLIINDIYISLSENQDRTQIIVIASLVAMFATIAAYFIKAIRLKEDDL